MTNVQALHLRAVAPSEQPHARAQLGVECLDFGALPWLNAYSTDGCATMFVGQTGLGAPRSFVWPVFQADDDARSAFRDRYLDDTLAVGTGWPHFLLSINGRPYADWWLGAGLSLRWR